MKRNLRSVSFLVILVVLLGGCSSILKKSELVLNEPILLRFQPPLGEKDITHYTYHSETRTYEEGSIRREKFEDMSFTVETFVKAINAKTQNRMITVTTTKKDGLIPLHDMALPELDETIEVEMDAFANILRAGDYPPNSQFYVPPLSLSREKVSKGDTWPMTMEWQNMSNALPLKLEMVSILKEFVPCYKKYRCAKIEISGNVKLARNPLKKSRFSSEVRGTLLVNIDTGVILSSEIHSEEELLTDGVRVHVTAVLKGSVQH